MSNKYNVKDPEFWEEKERPDNWTGRESYFDTIYPNAKSQKAQMRERKDSTKTSAGLSRSSSFDEIQDYQEVASDYLTDIFWNKIFYHSSFSGPSILTGSSLEHFTSASREADTSFGKFLSPDRVSKFRCLFYCNQADFLVAETYIGSFGSSTLETGITSINQDEMEYLAIFIDRGAVKLRSKNLNGITTKDIGIFINTDTTYKLEIDYYPRERADFYIDGNFVGAMTETLPTGINCPTYFPMMLSLKRTTASNPEVFIESWEFIQNRK